jgi:hypothetical protein
MSVRDSLRTLGLPEALSFELHEQEIHGTLDDDREVAAGVRVAH